MSTQSIVGQLYKGMKVRGQVSKQVCFAMVALALYTTQLRFPLHSSTRNLQVFLLESALSSLMLSFGGAQVRSKALGGALNVSWI